MPPSAPTKAQMGLDDIMMMISDHTLDVDDALLSSDEQLLQWVDDGGEVRVDYDGAVQLDLDLQPESLPFGN